MIATQELAANASPNPMADEVLINSNAMTFLKAVKKQFVDNPGVYEELLGILNDFKSNTINVPDVIQHISQLFSGYPHLIDAFNTFLSTKLQDQHPLKKDTFSIASLPGKLDQLVLNERKFRAMMLYREKVQAEFGDDLEEHVYNEFLSILTNLQAQTIDTLDIVWRISKLFSGYPTLVEGINPLLPDECRVQYYVDDGTNCVTIIRPPEVTWQSKDKNSAARPIARPRSKASPSAKSVSARKKATLNATLTRNKLLRLRRVYVHRVLSYLESVKEQFADNPSPYKDFVDVAKAYKKGTVFTTDVLWDLSYLFFDYPALFEGFSFYLPKGYHVQHVTDSRGAYVVNINTPERRMTLYKELSSRLTAAMAPDNAPSSTSPTQEFRSVIDFVAKIKKRFGDNVDKSKQFLDVLQSYNHWKDTKLLVVRVYEILENDPELISEFWKLISLGLKDREG